MLARSPRHPRGLAFNWRWALMMAVNAVLFAGLVVGGRELFNLIFGGH